MSWALVASSAIDDQPGSIMAASKDILDVLTEDRHGEYLTIFPNKPGVFVWIGTIDPSPDGIECIVHSLEPVTEVASIDYYMGINGSAP